jgi:hypothetical protein
MKTKTARKRAKPAPPEAQSPQVWTIPPHYSAKQLVFLYRHAQAHPEARYKIDRWPYDTLSAGQVLQWFRDKLMAKINRGAVPRGRKDSPEYALELDRLRPYVGTRFVLHWVSPLLGPRVKAALRHRFPEALDPPPAPVTPPHTYQVVHFAGYQNGRPTPVGLNVLYEGPEGAEAFRIFERHEYDQGIVRLSRDGSPFSYKSKNWPALPAGEN